METPNQPKGSPLDLGLDTMTQHYSTIHATRLILNALEKIQDSVKCGAPDINKIARNAYEDYKNFMALAKILLMQGVSLYPDNTWHGYADLQKAFCVTYDDMLSRLDQETKDILQSKGITL